MNDNILDDAFHAIAMHAFIEQAREQQAWPDSELTRRRAYAMYEADKDKRKESP